MADTHTKGAGALKESLGKLGESLTSPEMIRALSPAEALRVTPHTFQATEIEGRWKPGKTFGDGRELKPALPELKPNLPASAAVPYGLTSAEMSKPLAKAFPRLGVYRAEILTVEVKAVDLLQVPILSDLLKFVSGTTLGGRSIAKIEARWWADGLEIWAGHAGLAAALGFGSIFGHQAEIELEGVSFGNYFPAHYLVTFAGWVNPMGPTFAEFAGGVVLSADGSVTPAFGEEWVRDADRETEDPYSRVSELEWSEGDGYDLTINPADFI